MSNNFLWVEMEKKKADIQINISYILIKFSLC